jgi:hypothetical protein
MLAAIAHPVPLHAGKRSFLDALRAAEPIAPAAQKLTAAALVGFGIERCPSTATTPTSSACGSEYEFCEAEGGFVSSDDEAESVASSSLVCASPASTASLVVEAAEQPYSEEAYSEAATISELDEDEDPDYSEDSLHSAAPFSFWTGLDRPLRLRHNALQGQLGKQARKIQENVRTRVHSSREVLFFNHRVKAADTASTFTHRLRSRASGSRRPTSSSSSTAVTSAVPRSPLNIPNPYSGWTGEEKDEGVEEDSEDEKKPKGAKKQDRRELRVSSRGLAASTRPAIANAGTSKHREVLVARAARKQAVKQLTESHRDYLPRHLRPSSRNVTSHRLHLRPSARDVAVGKEDASPNAMNLRAARGFEDFRRRFFAAHQAKIETALDGSHVRTAEVRMCPITSHASSAFMGALRSTRPTQGQLELVYHGTHVRNMNSICNRGLLVPGRGPNPISVTNGSACGVGIYSSKSAEYSTGYTRDCSTMFVCAVITAGAGKRSQVDGWKQPAVLINGDMIVLGEERRICPLFLLDFAPAPAHAARGVSQSTSVSTREAWIPLALARALLGMMNTKLRAQNISRRDAIETLEMA